MACIECEGPVPPLKCSRCGTTQRVDRTSTAWETAFLAAWQNTSLSLAERGQRIDVCSELADQAVWALTEARGALGATLGGRRRSRQVSLTPAALEPVYEAFTELRQAFTGPEPRPDAHISRQKVLFTLETLPPPEPKTAIKGRRILEETPGEDLTLEMTQAIEYVIFGQAGAARRAAER